MGTVNRKKTGLTDADRARLGAQKPQDRFGRNGYTMMPHSYFGVLGRKCSGYAQFFAIGYIMDRTFGAPTNPDYAKVTLSTLARLTGLSAQAFSAVLEDAVARGLIERKEAGSGLVYRAWPEAWAAIDDYKPAAKAVADDAAGDGVDDDDDAAGDGLKSRDVEVAPGKSAKPIVLSVQFKDVEKPVDLKFHARNESGLPLVFSTSLGNSGAVHFTVRKCEEKANNHQVQLIAPTVTTYTSQQLAEFKTYLTVVCLKHFDKAADPVLVKNVVMNKGGATLTEYAKIVERRMRRLRKSEDAGVLILAAKDAALAHEARAKIAQPAKAAVDDRTAMVLEAVASRVGRTVEEFRLICGVAEPSEADYAAWVGAEAKIYEEFGVEVPAYLLDMILHFERESASGD